MSNILTPEQFFMAIDHDRPAGNVIRPAYEWWRFYEIAKEQVEKYGLDGAGIPIGSTVMDVNGATFYENINRPRTYRGVSGNKMKFLGVYEGSDKYLSCEDRHPQPMLVNRDCWWRYIAVVDYTESI